MIHQERDLVAEVTPLVKEAGSIVLSYFHKRLTWTEKVEHGVDHGFVTEADLASERYLIEKLTAVMPQANVIAEESGMHNISQSDYCWVIDPLDGTTNFAHGLPYFCISVALTYQNKPVFGMIYQPLTQELFYATAGQGAYLNGVAMKVSHAPLEKSVIALGLPYEKNVAYEQTFQSGAEIANRAYAIRYFGAVALDCAYVAAGRLEGVLFADLGWWDVAAGIILVQEAGGQVSDFQGRVVGPDYTSFIATGSQEVRQGLLELVRGIK